MSIILIEDPREAALQIGHVLLSQGEGTSLTRYGVLDAGAMVHPDTSYHQSKDALIRQDGHEFGVSGPSTIRSYHSFHEGMIGLTDWLINRLYRYMSGCIG